MTDTEIRNRAAEVLRKLATWRRQGTLCLSVCNSVAPIPNVWPTAELEALADGLESPPGAYSPRTPLVEDPILLSFPDGHFGSAVVLRHRDPCPEAVLVLLEEAAALLRNWPIGGPRRKPAIVLAKKLLQAGRER